MSFFVIPQYSKDTIVVPACIRVVLDGTATYKNGRIEHCDYIAFEILCVRLIIGVVYNDNRG